MPQPHTLALFLAAAAVLVLIPGPNHLYILARAAAGGPRTGAISALGVETGTLIHAAAAAIGLSSLLAASATAYDLVRYLGAGYLIYLGIRTLTSKDTPHQDTAPHSVTGTRAFTDGLVVNVLNPKVALFFLAFLPQFVDPAQGPAAPQILALGLIMAALGLAGDLAIALGGGALARRATRGPRTRRLGRYAIGGIYLTLGAATALTGRR
jgi:threonine/homoserine/homoserine lactone efflux protein